MTVQITIRNVPDEVRDKLAVGAARKRQSMQAFLLDELERVAARSNNEMVFERVHARLAATNSRVDAETIVNAIKADRK